MRGRKGTDWLTCLISYKVMHETHIQFLKQSPKYISLLLSKFLLIWFWINLGILILQINIGIAHKIYLFFSTSQPEHVQCKRHQCQSWTKLPDPGSIQWIPQANGCLDERNQRNWGWHTYQSKSGWGSCAPYKHQGWERRRGPIQTHPQKPVRTRFRISQCQCVG